MDLKSEFRNATNHIIGYVYYDEDDKRRGGAVSADETVWLSEKDQIATANAPHDPADNPLTNGALVEVTAATEIASRRPLRPEAEVAPPNVEQPVEGELAGAEVVPANPTTEEADAEEEPAEESVEPAPEPEADEVPAEESPDEPEKELSPSEIAAQRSIPPAGPPIFEPQPEDAETGTGVDPLGEPPEGERAAAEEVGTPSAPAAPPASDD